MYGINTYIYPMYDLNVGNYSPYMVGGDPSKPPIVLHDLCVIIPDGISLWIQSLPHHELLQEKTKEPFGIVSPPAGFDHFPNDQPVNPVVSE